MAFSLLLICLLSWAFASPLGSTPDEDYHLASIWCGQGERDGLCEYSTEKAGDIIVPASTVEAANCFAFHPELSANCPIKPASETTVTGRSNADGGYPPVFYWVMGAFAGPNLVLSVLLMRIFNSVLFVGMLLTTFLLSSKSLRVPLLWGIAITVVPLGMFLIPSVNPSSWALISATVLWASLTGFFNAKSNKQRTSLGIIAGLATLIGAGARSDAAVYSGIAVVVAIILSWKKVSEHRLMLLLPVGIVIVALAFFFSGGQSSVVAPDGSAATNASIGVVALAFANLALLPQLWTGVLGTWGLGWLDTTMPGIVWVTSVAMFSAFVFAGLKSLNKVKALAVSLLFLCLIAIPLYILVNDRVMVGAGVQPRYIFPLMIMFAGVSLTALRAGKDTFSRAQVWIAVSGLTIANSLALHTNIRRYVTGIDTGGVNLDEKVEWWWTIPVGPMWIWALGTIAFGLTLSYLAIWTLKNWDTELVSLEPGLNSSK